MAGARVCYSFLCSHYIIPLEGVCVFASVCVCMCTSRFVCEAGMCMLGGGVM